MHKNMKKEKRHEKIAVILFLTVVIMISGIALLRDPRVVSYATKEKSISIINEQSYAAVNNEWAIRFKTEGRGDLEISEIKDAFYDIGPLQIRCGDRVMDYQSEGGKITAADYTCDQIGVITTKIREEGIQTLKITFGNKDYASNIATTKENL